MVDVHDFELIYLKPTIDSILSHVVAYFHDISRTCLFTLTNVQQQCYTLQTIIKACTYLYKT